jgi:hypothetical protein
LTVLPFQQFHCDESLAVTLVDGVDGAYIRMIKRRGSPSFPAKTFEGLGIASDFFGQELQGHKATETCVLGLVDNPHTTATEFLRDAVVRDGLTDHAQECYGGRLIKSMTAI